MSYNLLMFSGGIDSTYVAYDFLRRNQKEYLLLHHIKLHNKQNRMLCEDLSCKKITTYLKENNFNNFVYSESSFNYGDIKHLIYDIEIVAFHMYILLQHPYYNIKNILLPFYMNKSKDRYDKFFNIIKLSNKDVNFSFPISKMTKCQVINRLPKNLLNITWYCRTPINKQPCHTCETCLAVRSCR